MRDPVARRPRLTRARGRLPDGLKSLQCLAHPQERIAVASGAVICVCGGKCLYRRELLNVGWRRLLADLLGLKAHPRQITITLDRLRRHVRVEEPARHAGPE